MAFVLQLAYLVSSFMLFGVDQQALRKRSGQSNGRLTGHLAPIALLMTIALFTLLQDWRALAPVIALPLAWLSIKRNQSLRDHSFALYMKAHIAYQVFVIACVVMLFLSGNRNWYWWLLPYALPSVVVLFIEATKTWRIHPRRIFEHLSKTSLQLFPSTIAAIVVLRADRLLMPTLSSNAQLGLYVAVATATELIYWFAQALADHRVSRFSSSRTVKSLMLPLAVDTVIFTLVASFVGVLISAILIPILGPEFAAARQLVLPLSIAAVVLAIYRQFIAWHLGGPNPGTVSFIEVTTAVFALPCYWFSILSSGALGAAWGSLAVYTFGFSLSLIAAVTQRRRLLNASELTSQPTRLPSA